MTPAIIFDFDGTIGETIPLALHAMRTAYKELNLRPPSVETLEANFGPTELGLLKRLSPEHADKLFALYLKEYERAHEKYSPRPFIGIRDTLRNLKKNGALAAVVTGKCRESAEISLKHYGLNEFFDTVETGGLEGTIKPEKIAKILTEWNFSPSNTYYIGDSVQDIIDSKKAGVVPLAAAWSELANADALAKHSPAEIFKSVEGFSSWLIERGFLPMPS